MVRITNHGGGCCGYAHIHDFDNTTLAQFGQAIRDRDAEGNRGRILEAILSARQVSGTDARIDRSIIDAGGWPRVLASQGFRLSAIWDNSNSNNRCFQFLRLGDTGAWVDEPTDYFRFPWHRFSSVEGEDAPTIDVPLPAPTFTDGRRPARVDPALPVRLYVRALGRSFPARIEAVGGRSVSVRIVGEHLEVPRGIDGATYRLDQGQWSGDTTEGTRARVFNVQEGYEDPPAPAVVDPDRPVRIYSPPHQRSFNAVVMSQGRHIGAAIVDPAYTRGPHRNLANHYYYVTATGEWQSDPTVAWLFNPVEEVAEAVEAVPAPDPAPEPMVTENFFRARFRNGQMSLLRFGSVAALRERYPNVGTIVLGNGEDGWEVIDEEDYE